MFEKARASLELIRPANIITAFADILAGFAAVGGVLVVSSSGIKIEPWGLIWLLIATFGLYGGGIVFNDVFDADLDAKERPERAIPSGRISKIGATLLGFSLYVVALVSAIQVSSIAVGIASFIIVFSLIYDAKAKHSVIFGPLCMGLCRGGNLLLGGSIFPFLLLDIWFIALIPIIYIAAITLISRGEVFGGRRIHGYLALGMICLVIIAVLLLAFTPIFEFWIALPFLILFGAMVIPPFLKAANSSKAEDIKIAVKRGVVSLVIFNSVLGAGYGGIQMGILILTLFPLSMWISTLFEVT